MHGHSSSTALDLRIKLTSGASSLPNAHHERRWYTSCFRIVIGSWFLMSSLQPTGRTSGIWSSDVRWKTRPTPATDLGHVARYGEPAEFPECYFSDSCVFIAFSWSMSIVCCFISLKRLHQSRPETMRSYVFSFELIHIPRSIMSAFMGSFGRNQTQAKQFSDCHVSFFRLSFSSESVGLMLQFSSTILT